MSQLDESYMKIDFNHFLLQKGQIIATFVELLLADARTIFIQVLLKNILIEVLFSELL